MHLDRNTRRTWPVDFSPHVRRIPYEHCGSIYDQTYEAVVRLPPNQVTGRRIFSLRTMTILS